VVRAVRRGAATTGKGSGVSVFERVVAEALPYGRVTVSNEELARIICHALATSDEVRKALEAQFCSCGGGDGDGIHWRECRMLVVDAILAAIRPEAS
jgi:hypothetical protein